MPFPRPLRRSSSRRRAGGGLGAAAVIGSCSCVGCGGGGWVTWPGSGSPSESGPSWWCAVCLRKLRKERLFGGGDGGKGVGDGVEPGKYA